MRRKIKNGIALSLIPQIILIQWLSAFPEIIEKYYSQGFYPYFSQFLRLLNGWIPFSFGDLLYLFLGIYALYYLITRRKCIWKKPLSFLRNGFVVLSVAYFTFYICWGLNYYRLPIIKALEIEENLEQEDLISFTNQLIEKTNQAQLAITNDSTAIVKTPYSHKKLFALTLVGYERLEKIHPFLSYQRPSLKKSIFSVPLTYMGYGGYLNPFTNEAQVNSLIPAFRSSVVSGHEVGHQIGYSAENETNLIGYLVAMHHDDIYFKYAAYAYALGYCLRDIQEFDQKLFYSLRRKINAGVLLNYEELNNFWKNYDNSSEPLFKAVFNSFLKANRQTDGINSYSKVVLLLVGYHKKYPL